MKRILAIALVAAFILGSVSFASAAELKVTGEFKSNAQWQGNSDFSDDNSSEDEFGIRSRARIIFRYSASDNLSAVLRIQYGTIKWGNQATGGLIDTQSNTNIYLRRAYLEFKWPDTQILMQAGKLSLALPNYLGSAILGADTTAFVVSSPITDNVKLMAGFARAIDANVTDDGDDPLREEWDHIFLGAPLSFDGISLTPFVDFSILGNGITAAGIPDSVLLADIFSPAGAAGQAFDDDYVYPWWAGLVLNMKMFDPFIVKGEFNWGMITDGEDATERSGWLADLELSYTGIDFMVPKIFGMYSSGEDDDIDNGSERMPIAADDWTPKGSYFFGGSDLLDGDLDNPTVGLWTVGLALEDIKFIDKLSSLLAVYYIAGTSDSAIVDEAPGYLTYGRQLTDEDYLVEIDFNHKYMIYEQLAAILELSYDRQRLRQGHLGHRQQV